MTVTCGSMSNIGKHNKYQDGKMMVTCDISVQEVNDCVMQIAHHFLVCG